MVQAANEEDVSPRGGKRKGAGRPKGTTDPTARRSVLQVRVAEEDLEAWRLAAELEGKPLSEAVREQMNRWADRKLKR